MSLKAELETWASALVAYDEEDFDKALDLFSQIADSSKILTNMGLIYATLGEHELATEQFNAACSLDNYLAVAYFQCGVSNFLLGRYELSLKDFDEALLYLRGNQAINYEQLGLKFKLFSAEVLFNKGLSLIYMGSVESGMAELRAASREKATEEHNVIDDAIGDRGEGYTVFSIPVGILYRPSESKLKNSKTKDYLGKAKLVAASDANDAFTTFTGVTRLKQGISPSGTRVDRPSSDPSPSTETIREKERDIRDVRPPNKLAKASEGGGVKLGRSATTTGATATAPRVGTGLSGPSRSNTTSRAIGGGGRGIARRTTTPPGQDGVAPLVPPKGIGATGGMADVYDDLIDTYTDADPSALERERERERERELANIPIPPIPDEKPSTLGRVQAWARGASGAPPPPSAAYSYRTMSVRAPSMYSGNGAGGGSLRRRGTKNGKPPPSIRAQSTYEDEEEGYVSGEYEDVMYELVKIRVKIHHNTDTRGMALDPATPYDDFIDKLCRKFDRSFGALAIRFKDEDGLMISMRDESDYELAIETARESARGKPEGKLEVWAEDQ